MRVLISLQLCDVDDTADGDGNGCTLIYNNKCIIIIKNNYIYIYM